MGAERFRLMICESPQPAVRVVRFIRPDLRTALDTEPIEQCPLFDELRAEALGGLPAGGTLVLNFGLVDPFNSPFYRFLLQLNKELKAAGSRLLLCCLPQRANEPFELFAGPRTFAGQVFEAESTAIYSATHPATG